MALSTSNAQLFGKRLAHGNIRPYSFMSSDLSQPFGEQFQR